MRKSSTRAVRRSSDLPTTRGAAVRLQPRLGIALGLQTWERRIHDERELIVLDLFCGAGGLSQGFHDAGFFVAAGTDADPSSVETFAANFLAKAVTRDLTGIGDAGVKSLVQDELGIPRVSVIIGGPPCQGFAGVGRAKIRSLSDDARQRLAKRNHLYQEFVQFVETLQPLCFVMENVPHLASFDDGRVADQIREDFDRMGYDLGTVETPGQALFLDAEDFGVPQTRRRLFFLGFRRGRTASIAPPRPTHYGRFMQPRSGASERPPQLPLRVPHHSEGLAGFFLAPPRTLADAISDLPRVAAPILEHVQTYDQTDRHDLIARGALRDREYSKLMRCRMAEDEQVLLYDHVVRPVREDDAEAFRYMPEGGTYFDVPEDYRRYKVDAGHFKDRYFRLPWDQPSRAITAHMAKDGYWYIHPDKDQGRTLSVREAARVQSFPDHFRFAGHRTAMYRMIGNAVPPLLAHAIASQIREAVERASSGDTWTPELLTACTDNKTLSLSR